MRVEASSSTKTIQPPLDSVGQIGRVWIGWGIKWVRESDMKRGLGESSKWEQLTVGNQLSGHAFL